MRLARWATIGVCLLVIGSFGSLAIGTVVETGVALGASVVARATIESSSTFYATSLSSGQPSPYCLVNGGSLLILCYTPQDLKVAYNYPTGLNGAGQTIVLLDAFGDPTVQADLNTFDTTFGLPATKVQVVCQGGTCPVFNASNPDELGWSQEIALDTQYSHAMAPAAHIVLFVAQSDDDLVLEQAALQAVEMFPHSILSQSFGDPEPDLLSAPASYVAQVLATGEAAYALAGREGTSVFASAGDYGADNYAFGYTAPNPSFPSSSPLVTAVGGTEGNPYFFSYPPTPFPCGAGPVCSTGLVKFANNAACSLNDLTPTSTPSCTPVGYGGEQVWNESVLIGAGSGGAPSSIFGVPSYQFGLGLTGRATPDVSYDAAVDGGVLTYWSANASEAGFYITGGTSAGSPQWAAITALADQLSESLHRGTLGFLNPAIYRIGHTPSLYRLDFHDITVGNNGVLGPAGFNAGPGWDDASGWGTPNVANLVPELVILA